MLHLRHWGSPSASLHVHPIDLMFMLENLQRTSNLAGPVTSTHLPWAPQKEAKRLAWGHTGGQGQDRD